MMYDRNTIVSVSETYFHSFHDFYEDNEMEKVLNLSSVG